MAYVPGFEHDVFVSYAHVDNERGWVTKLVKELEVRLAERLGSPRPSVWIDHKILGNEPLSQIFETIKRAATLLLVHSPGYLKSEWCRNELLAFAASQNRQGNRVFVVRTEQYDSHIEPEELRDLTGYDFWVTDKVTGITMRLGTTETRGKERQYAAAITRLAVQLAQTLETAAPQRISASAEKPARVFLAELPDEALEPKRTQVEESLTQARIEVIPADPQLVANLAEFEAWARAALPGCTAFVQLLSANSGRTRAIAKGLPILQFQLARETGVRHLIQWRDPDLALDSVTNEEHRALLRDVTVRTSGLQELVSEVFRAVALAGGAAQEAATGPSAVFVNGDLCDRALAERVERSLTSRGVSAVLPPVRGKPRQIREFFLDKLLSCDAALIVHRDSQWSWVKEQVNQIVEKNIFRKMLAPPRSPAMVALLKRHNGGGETLDADSGELASYEISDDADDAGLGVIIDKFVQTLRAQAHGQGAV